MPVVSHAIIFIVEGHDKYSISGLPHHTAVYGLFRQRRLSERPQAGDPAPQTRYMRLNGHKCWAFACLRDHSALASNLPTKYFSKGSDRQLMAGQRLGHNDLMQRVQRAGRAFFVRVQGSVNFPSTCSGSTI